eukprot:1085245-Amphidinium_carterae.1
MSNFEDKSRGFPKAGFLQSRSNLRSEARCPTTHSRPTNRFAHCFHFAWLVCFFVLLADCCFNSSLPCDESRREVQTVRIIRGAT